MSIEDAFEEGGGPLGDGPDRDFPDNVGTWPSKIRARMEKIYFHAGRGHLYKIVGYGFDSERERWMIMYRRVSVGGLTSGPVFSHLPEDFDRDGRFQEVKR